jgi:hypothetical protein
MNETYTIARTKKQSNKNKNLEGDLEIVITDLTDNQWEKTKINIVKQEGTNNYIINPVFNIDLLKSNKLSKSAVNKILSGDKIEFKQLDRKTKQISPIDIQVLNRKNAKVSLLNPQEKFSVKFRYSNEEGIREIEPPANFEFEGDLHEVEERLARHISNYFFGGDFMDNNMFNENEETYLRVEKPIKLLVNDELTLDFDYVKKNREAPTYFIEKKEKHAKLKQLYNEELESIENPENINCCVYYFKRLYETKKRAVYKKIYTELESIEKVKHTIFLNDLINVFNKNDITIYLYVIGGLLYYEKYNAQYTEVSKCNSIVLYIEDNHLYTINSKKYKNHLTRKSQSEYNTAIVKQCLSTPEPNKLLESFIFNCNNDKITGKPVYLAYDKNNNEMITNNENNDVLLKFVNLMGLDKSLLSCTITNFINKLKDKYNISIYSIFPFKVSNQVLMYKNNDIKQDKNSKLINLDKNKCFSNALYDAPFIPIFNIFTDIKREYIENEKIIDHYIYFIEVLDPNNLYFNHNYKTGYFINKVGFSNKDIKIKYVFECDIYKEGDGNPINPYKNLINDLYKHSKTEKEIKFIKQSINAHIGQMLTTSPEKIKYNSNYKYSNVNDLKLLLNNTDNNDNIIDFDNLETNENKYIKYDCILHAITMRNDIGYSFIKKNEEEIDEEYIFHWEINDMINKHMGEDNKPLHILIRDISQLYILEMINKLKISKEKLIEINTDSIYFVDDDNKIDLSNVDNDPNNFKKWKIEKGYKSTQLKSFKYSENNIEPQKDIYFYEKNKNKYNFNLEYAGGGKTYRIKKIIDEELKKNPKYSYIILSSFNDFITDYRKNGYNTATIAYCMFHDINIKEKNIYIDEFGICSLNEILYLFRHFNKTFNIYGDLKQLTPVNSKKINLEFIKSIANEYNTDWKNMRNAFTKEFYDFLIDDKIKKNVKQLVNIYNYPMEKASKIICYYNNTADKYNKIMLEKNNQSFNKNNISVGIPIKNNTNRLEVKKTNGEIDLIFNRHSFNITKKNNENEYIINDDINDYIISKDVLLQNFSVAYCLTLYSVQGKTYDSIYYVNDEADRNALNNKGALYTLISRLRFKDILEYENKVFEENIKSDNEEFNNIINFFNNRKK